MGLYLADTIKSLPSTELRRLQKSLRLIYNPHTPVESLRGSILRAYNDLGCPLEKIRSVGLEEVFSRLLRSFGTLDARTISEEDRKKLQKLPYTFWPDDSHCFVSAEILDLLSADASFKKENYLFNAIRRLSARERMAWVRWIDLDPQGRSGKDLVTYLYAHLASMQKEQLNKAKSELELPIYLDEVWADNPMDNKVAWYYREVLPFYQCLAEEEQNLLKKKQSSSIKYKILQLIKSGQVHIEKEADSFGQPTRYRLCAAHESQPTKRYITFNKKIRPEATAEVTEKQGMLF